MSANGQRAVPCAEAKVAAAEAAKAEAEARLAAARAETDDARRALHSLEGEVAHVEPQPEPPQVIECTKALLDELERSRVVDSHTQDLPGGIVSAMRRVRPALGTVHAEDLKPHDTGEGDPMSEMPGPCASQAAAESGCPMSRSPKRGCGACRPCPPEPRREASSQGVRTGAGRQGPARGGLRARRVGEAANPGPPNESDAASDGFCRAGAMGDRPDSSCQPRRRAIEADVGIGDEALGEHAQPDDIGAGSVRRGCSAACERRGGASRTCRVRACAGGVVAMFGRPRFGS